MGHDDYDDGLVHAHDWAGPPVERVGEPLVADVTSVNTPSSVFHDDVHHAE